jgi:hypothetical protein
MKLRYKILFLTPLIALACLLGINIFIRRNTIISPVSDLNNYQNELTNTLALANISPIYLKINFNFRETEFIVKDKPTNFFKVIFSIDKNTLSQVNALQNLIKIANIKEKQIQVIDLSSSRPYATL